MVKFYYSCKHDLRNRNAPLVTEHAIQRLSDDPIEMTARLSRQHLSISAVPLIIKILLGGEISQLRSPMDDRARGAAIYEQTLSLTTRRRWTLRPHRAYNGPAHCGVPPPLTRARPRPPARPPAARPPTRAPPSAARPPSAQARPRPRPPAPARPRCAAAHIRG